MKRAVFSVFLIVLLVGVVSGAENLARTMGTATASGNNRGDIRNLIDGNANSYVGSTCSGNGCSTSLTTNVNFESPVSLLEKVVVRPSLFWGGSGSRIGGSIKVQVKSNGAWKQVDSKSYGYNQPAPNDCFSGCENPKPGCFRYPLISVSGNWENVDAVRAISEGAIGGHSSCVGLYVSEIEAYGKNEMTCYVDKDGDGFGNSEEPLVVYGPECVKKSGSCSGSVTSSDSVWKYISTVSGGAKSYYDSGAPWCSEVFPNRNNPNGFECKESSGSYCLNFIGIRGSSRTEIYQCQEVSTKTGDCSSLSEGDCKNAGCDWNVEVSCEDTACPEGYVDNPDDCDDDNANNFPGNTEDCADGFDNDCNGLVDCEDETCVSKEICTDPEIEKAFWANMNDEPIDEADLNDVVQMVVHGERFLKTAGVKFQIFEKDCLGLDECNAIADFLDPDELVDESTSKNWRTSAEGEFVFDAVFEGFDFNIMSEKYDYGVLKVSGEEDDDPIEVILEEPLCGSIFEIEEEGVEVNIKGSIFDEDDILVYSYVEFGDGTRKNVRGDFEFNKIYYEPGEYQVVAYGENADGEKKRVIANIIVYDKDVNGKYAAACINKPKDFSEVMDSNVEIDASTSRGLIVNSKDVEIIKPSERGGKLEFEWGFSNGDKFKNLDNEEKSYYFGVNFGKVGNNWADLKVGVL